MGFNHLVIAALFMALVFYVLSGGADYGAGLWSIFVSRKLKDRQRSLIEKAIQPIWEANHVWLILVVVILFMGYPEVYAFVCTSLNIPISLSLLGLVMRGTAFISQKYGTANDALQGAWSHIFAGASIVTPFLFGAMIGAISSGHLELPTEDIWRSLFAPWLSPYSLCLGGFTLAIFAMLAASYLTVDAEGDEELQDSYRTRALISHGVVAFFALASVLFAAQEDVWIYHRIAELPWAFATGGGFILCFAATIASLVTRHFHLARVLAATEGFIILLGYAVAQFPYLVPPKLTIYNSAAPQVVLITLLIALSIGAVLLFPSLFYLFRVFKGEGEHSTQGAPLE
jgi:cytochrome d ubiquinol oxidase subunit II